MRIPAILRYEGLTDRFAVRAKGHESRFSSPVLAIAHAISELEPPSATHLRPVRVEVSELRSSPRKTSPPRLRHLATLEYLGTGGWMRFTYGRYKSDYCDMSPQQLAGNQPETIADYIVELNRRVPPLRGITRAVLLGGDL